MARIRTIKPEFPHSESMGRVSRDARLLFVMLWPICDDHGRTRAASRMLASLLFPYDDDAPELIGGWLDELERENCIRRYSVNGSTFLEICNWLIHQKIDKPSKPQFPEPPGALASVREDSSLEGKGREGKGEDQEQEAIASLPATAGVPSCPHDAIVALYHELLPANPRIKVWDGARADSLRARWREDAKRQSLDYWRRFFVHVAASPFLTGKADSRDGRPFLPGLDWLVKAANFAKVIEGRYHDAGVTA
jgi:hypothetical protein